MLGHAGISELAISSLPDVVAPVVVTSVYSNPITAANHLSHAQTEIIVSTPYTYVLHLAANGLVEREVAHQERLRREDAEVLTLLKECSQIV
jgi:hypothetical protein